MDTSTCEDQPHPPVVVIDAERTESMIHSHYPNTRSTISCLPTEILSIVFLFFCGSYSAHDTSLPPQFILAQVCGAWMLTAYHTPHLWSTLNAYLPHRFSVECRKASSSEAVHALIHRRGSRYARWLNRSGEVPLTISFFDKGGNCDSDVRTLFQYIVPFLPRCQALALTCCQAALPAVLDLSSLRSLCLDLDSHHVFDPRSLFLPPPHLHHLQVEGQMFRVWTNWLLKRSVPLMLWPTDELTLIGSRYDRPSTYLAAFIACPNMTRCNLILPRRPLVQKLDSARLLDLFDHKALKSLSFRVHTTSGGRMVADLLAIVRVPQLADLHIELCHRGRPIRISSNMQHIFEALVERGSADNLRSIKFTAVWGLSLKVLNSVLSMLPALKLVELCDCTFLVAHDQVNAALQAWAQANLSLNRRYSF